MAFIPLACFLPCRSLYQIAFTIAVSIVSLFFAGPMQAAEDSNPESAVFKKIADEEGDNIYRHNDIYVISGKRDTKIQLSLKLKLIKRWELYAAYSQIIFWELLRKESSPFRDASYNPEFFYSYAVGKGFWRTVSVGIEHRSNGKDDIDSRSFDRIFAQSNNEFGFGDAKITWNMRLFGFYDLDKTNRNLQEYYGFWETRFAVANLFDEYFPSNSEVYLRFFPGGKYSNAFWKGGREFGVKFRARILGFMPYILIQGYYGHSESLLDYDKNQKVYRIGFLL